VIYTDKTLFKVLFLQYSGLLRARFIQVLLYFWSFQCWGVLDTNSCDTVFHCFFFPIQTSEKISHKFTFNYCNLALKLNIKRLIYSTKHTCIYINDLEYCFIILIDVTRRSSFTLTKITSVLFKYVLLRHGTITILWLYSCIWWNWTTTQVIMSNLPCSL
jgi:hypothetical protein